MELTIKIYGDTKSFNTEVFSHYMTKAFVQHAGNDVAAQKIVLMHESASRKDEENSDSRVYKELMAKSLEMAGKLYFRNFLMKEIITKEGMQSFILNEKKYVETFLDQVSLSLYPEAELV